MAARKEDEIMAEYLLKGGKMLEKTCRTCGCPQFEYKGKTFCVVCTEREQEKRAAGSRQAGQKEPEARKSRTPPATGIQGSAPKEPGSLGPELSATLLDLCRRIREEDDPDRCLALMDAVRTGAEALQILRQV